MKVAGRRWQVAVCLFLLVSCRSGRPAGEPFAPLTAANEQEAIAALNERKGGARSLMRIRATHGERTQSFRAQLQVDNAGRMLLVAYTPVGTSALTLFADRDRVTFIDHVNRTTWQGSAAELAQSVGFFDAATLPADWAHLVLGFPAGQVTATPTGLAGATLGAVSFTFDPPAHPPQSVVVTRGASRLEITHQELVRSGDSVAAPNVPRDYTCCVAPKL